MISFDLNYRASFWEGRNTELAKAFEEIASEADILVGNEEDFQSCLGFKGPETGGEDLSEKIESFKGMISRVKERFVQSEALAVGTIRVGSPIVAVADQGMSQRGEVSPDLMGSSRIGTGLNERPGASSANTVVRPEVMRSAVTKSAAVRDISTL